MRPLFPYQYGMLKCDVQVIVLLLYNLPIRFFHQTWCFVHILCFLCLVMWPLFCDLIGHNELEDEIVCWRMRGSNSSFSPTFCNSSLPDTLVQAIQFCRSLEVLLYDTHVFTWLWYVCIHLHWMGQHNLLLFKGHNCSYYDNQNRANSICKKIWYSLAGASFTTKCCVVTLYINEREICHLVIWLMVFVWCLFVNYSCVNMWPKI